MTINPEAVARRALELFAARGYEAVSMAEIAIESGIARKSLYRYFDSKPALVWGGLLTAVDVSWLALEEGRSDGSSVGERLLAASVGVAAALPDLEVTRGRLRVISEHEELMAHAPVVLEEQRHRVNDFLLANGIDADRSHYLSTAYSSVSFSAWIRWARSNEPGPELFLEQALRVLRFSDV